MATVNTVPALQTAKNTGVPRTALDPKNIKGMFLTPKGLTLTALQVASLQTTLSGLAFNASKSARIYPFANFVDFKDSSEEPIVEKFGYGGRKTTRDGINDWGFRFEKGGQQLLNAARSFNGDDWDALYVDNKGVLIGTSWIDGTGAQGIKAIPTIEFYANPAKNNDGKNNTQYWLNHCFDPKFINEEIAFVNDPGFDILDLIVGLGNAVLSSPGAGASSGHFSVLIKDDLGNNLSDLFGAATFAAGLWKAYNYQTGAAIDITSVTPAAFSGENGFDVLLDTTDTDYPATGGQKVAIDQASISSWTTAGVDFESTGAVAIVKN